jgi:hypothetical protein
MLSMYLGCFALFIGLAAGLAGTPLSVAAATLPSGVAQAAVPDSQDGADIVLQITSPKSGDRLRGPVEITGYAFDPRSPTAEGIALAQQAPPVCSSGQEPNGLCSSGLNERDIRIWLNSPSDPVNTFDPWNLFDYAVPGQDNPEAAARGARFAKTGFWDAWETCSFSAAPYRLTVLVSSLVVPNTYQVASVDVYVESCGTGQPIVSDTFEGQPGGVYTQRLTAASTRGPLLDPIFADFAAGITARCTDPTVDCSYGLEFRVLPGPGGMQTNSFYRFTVDPTRGQWTLGYSPPGDDPIIRLIDWTPSPLIRPGTAPNRLAVIVQGDWLRVFINGQQLSETHDDRRPWGQVGWLAATTDQGRTVEAQFSNFLVTTPGPAEELATLFPDNASTSVVAPPPATPASVTVPAERPSATRIDNVPVTLARYAFQTTSSLRRSSPNTVVLQDDSLGEVWQLDVAAGDCVLLTMRSNDFAPYLVLRHGAPFGEQIAVDGSGGEARIRRALPSSGTYYFTATSAGEGLQEGSYTLAMRLRGRHLESGAQCGPSAFRPSGWRVTLRCTIHNASTMGACRG